MIISHASHVKVCFLFKTRAMMSYRPNYSAHPSSMVHTVWTRLQPCAMPLTSLNEYLHFGETCTGSPIHTKDGELFSVNYLHAGAVKIWYFIEWVVTWSIRCRYWRNVIYTVSHWLGFAPPLMCRAWMDIYTCISARPAMGSSIPTKDIHVQQISQKVTLLFLMDVSSFYWRTNCNMYVHYNDLN